MKILHTADWHLGSRLGRIDRADDLRRAVGRVIDACDREAVDVLLIAGDLFDDVHRADDVRDAVELLKGAVGPFLRRGGTILAVAGNHDKETFIATLQHALALADPAEYGPGAVLAPGRFHLATTPRFNRLAGRDGRQVQFVLMPYPWPSRYLDAATQCADGGGGRNRRLREEFAGVLRRIRGHSKFDPALQSVLVAHIGLQGATMPGGYELTADDEGDHIVCPPEDLGAGWAYVALGDIHKPQALGGRAHVRYSGSIERLSIDERGDEKGMILVEVGAEGLASEPAWLALEATPMLDVAIAKPADQLPRLESLYPDAARALVRCMVTYTPGVDDTDAIHRRLDEVFPRCYRRDLVPAGRDDTSARGATAVSRRGLRETVMDYLKGRLEADGNPHAEVILAEAESLIEEARR